MVFPCPRCPQSRPNLAAGETGGVKDEVAGAAIAEYRRLNPYATGDKLAVAYELNGRGDTA